MKKLFFSFLFVLSVLFASYSCENAEPVVKAEQEPLPLQFTTDLIPAMNSRITSFKKGAQISLCVLNEELFAYNGKDEYYNVMATYNGLNWVLNPAVSLTENRAYIYAFYPAVDNFHGTEGYEVRQEDQIDYLYGLQAEGSPAINASNPVVKINMCHAMAMVQFLFRSHNYSGGAGKLTGIYVMGKPDFNQWKSWGILNILDGSISTVDSPRDPATVYDINGLTTITPDVLTNDADAERTSVLVFPWSTQKAGNVQIKFVIDGKNFFYDMGVENWQKGNKYTYLMTLTDNFLVNDKITISGWQDGYSGVGTIK